ncbi:hypothetical protein [Micromonospora sp. NPDC050200]|uniref:hypothetical protein n=1 Tax=Micromonospora sp. NPDC050200 TaxID=3155664 RepID=UPI0033D135B1
MIVESTTRTPPPRWPVNNTQPAPATWNQPTHPMPQERPRDWLPYAVLGGTAAIVGCFATVVVVLAQ